MKAAAIVLGFTAYTVYTWGYILIKGYNITLREWVTPLHPYSGTWPPAHVPPGSIFPTSKGGSGGGSPASTSATPAGKGSKGTGASQKQQAVP